MGNFYTSLSMLGPDEEAVAEFLRSEKRSAYVAPRVRGIVVVYDEECDQQDLEQIEALGRAMSSRFSCPVLAVMNHDDSHLVLRLFVAGSTRSRYNWFIDALPAGLKISWHFRQPFMAPFLVLVLALPWTLLQVFRHALMQKLMAWPSWAASGYNYISEGEMPIGLERDNLIQT